MRRPPRLLFAALLLLAVVFIFATVDRLPARIATHFGSAGFPNGWMTRGAYGSFLLAFAVLVPVLLVAVIGGLPHAFPDRINIPNRAYWLAPERRQESLAYLRDHAYRLGSLMVLFASGIHLLILEANTVVPPRLPGSVLVGMLAVFLVGMMTRIWTLYARFRRTP